MKTKYSFLYIITIVSLLCGGCDGSQWPEEEVVNLVDIAYHYDRRTSEWQDSVAKADESVISSFLHVVGDSTLSEWSHSRAVAVFTPDVERVFPSIRPVAHELGYILDKGEKEGLDFPKRRYAAVVWGRKEAILFVDSVMLIGLNHFLGADYPGYASIPRYMSEQKVPSQLPYAMAEALVGTSYPYLGEDNSTLLSRMMYEGVLVQAKLALVPASSPAEALGYSQEEYKEIGKSEQAIWEMIVKGNILYDTSLATSERLCNPSPFVQLGEMRWPGRIGRFIGWRIVKSYMDNNKSDSSLYYLLSPDFYMSPDVLLKSGY